MSTASEAEYFLGVDTGGTFTDFYLVTQEDCRTHKVLSTPDSPERAILQGIRELNLQSSVEQGQVVIVHGSTVATNAALERKGVKTAYVTNTGFADVLSLGRQNRDDIYALTALPGTPPVLRELCVEVPCRRSADGEIVTALSDDDLQTCARQIEQLQPEAVAINLLFSYLNGEEERRIAEAITGDYFVSLSSEVLPEHKEYERGMATWLNAWLGPKVASYIRRLQDGVAPCALGVMQSSGGTIDAKQASRKAVNLLLSGPAGGLAAAKIIGAQLERPRLMTFDMGGTSSDVALIDGDIKLTTQGKLGSYPVAVPMVDMHTIGAGGGSLAYLDDAGMLHVGPESSGANPGPACYGQGGQQATVTDANVVLGRIQPSYFLGGDMSLNVDAAESALTALGQDMGVTAQDAAKGVIDIANEHMVRALRVISVQQGYDPQDFDLCCFGGAGGLHVCALAEALGVKRIIVPANGGVLSALGMLVAPPHRQLSQTVNEPIDHLDDATIAAIVDDLSNKGSRALREEGVIGRLEQSVSVDVCYQGQSFVINLPYLAGLATLDEAFHRAHEKSYGHRLALPIHLVNLRVGISGSPLYSPEDKDPVSEDSIHQQSADDSLAEIDTEKVELPLDGLAQIWMRDAIRLTDVIRGPAIIVEKVATTFVAKGWQAKKASSGHLCLEWAGA